MNNLTFVFAKAIKGVWHVGKFYLVDSGYVNDVGFLMPFRSIMYHLEEFKKRNGRPSEREEVFNYTHASLRNIFEQTFGYGKNDSIY